MSSLVVIIIQVSVKVDRLDPEKYCGGQERI